MKLYANLDENSIPRDVYFYGCNRLFSILDETS